MISLTPRQAECLAFIQSYMDRNDGLAPAFQEVVEGMGLSSKGEVHRLFGGLERRGRIRRLAHRNRAIEIIEPLSPFVSKAGIADSILRRASEAGIVSDATPDTASLLRSIVLEALR